MTKSCFSAGGLFDRQQTSRSAHNLQCVATEQSSLSFDVLFQTALSLYYFHCHFSGKDILSYIVSFLHVF